MFSTRSDHLNGEDAAKQGYQWIDSSALASFLRRWTNIGELAFALYDPSLQAVQEVQDANIELQLRST